MTDLLPKDSVVAGYRIERLISHGFSGESYRATQVALDRPVALTMVDPKLAGDETFRARFLEAMRLAASLDHPNVVPVHEVRQEEGRLFVVSAYVEGDDLGDVLAREGKLEPQRAASVVAQAADAVAAAHAHGLVHGNLTAESVLLRKAGGEDQVLVGGFGFAAEDADVRSDVDGLTRLLAAAVADGTSADIPSTLATTLQRARSSDPATGFSTADELARALDGAAKEPTPSTRRRGVLVLAVALLVAAAIAGSLWAVATLGENDPLPTADAKPTADPVALMRPGTLREPVVLPSSGDVAVGEGFVWNVNPDGTLTKVDPRVNDVVGIPVRIGSFSGGVAAGEGAVWVGTEEGVTRVDPNTLEVEAPVDVGGATYDIAVGEGAVWALVATGEPWPFDTLVRIDPASGRVSQEPIELQFGRVERPEEESWALLAAEGSVWVSAVATGEILRVDPAAGSVADRIEVGGAPGELTALGGAVWTGDWSGQRIIRIDPRTGKVDSEPVIPREGVLSLASEGVALWLLTQNGTLRRIDPESAQIVGQPLRFEPGSGEVWRLAAGEGGTWAVGAGVTRVIAAPELPAPDRAALYDFSGAGPWTLPTNAVLPAGRYRTDAFRVPLSFAVGDGWRQLDAEEGNGAVLIEDLSRGFYWGSLAFLLVERVFSADASRTHPPPRNLEAWLRAHPHLTVSEGEDVTIGGLPARQLTVRVRTTPKPNPPECFEERCVLIFRMAENFEWAWSPGWVSRVLLVEVDGQTLVVMVESPPGRSADFFQKADALLRTLTFGPP